MERKEQANCIKYTNFDGIRIAEFRRGPVTEYIISASCGQNEGFADFLLKMQSLPALSETSVISQDIFGPHIEDPTITDPGHPVTWIQPPDYSGSCFQSTQIWAVKGLPVQRITYNQHVLGSLFEDDHTRICRLGGLGTTDPGISRQTQSRNTFIEMQQILLQAGMNFGNVLRTWFYNDHILDWYDEFNRVRTQLFKDYNMAPADLPASTGIGGSNPSGSALTAGLLAVTAKNPNTAWKSIESPMQKNPGRYGSSFSRAAELATPDYRRLFISGTASISRDGRTLHTSDIEKQIALTMQVVQSILESREMYWADSTRALVYLKEACFCDAWYNWCSRQNVSLPHCFLHADICRNDLLFEIELDAVSIN